jgi:RHS repeat-associated protein
LGIGGLLATLVGQGSRAARADECTPCRLYGDVYFIEGVCAVDVDDILCVVAGFSDPSLCPEGDIFPCGGDGLIDVDDLSAIVAAFAADYFCPHWPRVPEPGAPRPWERDLDVATYSSVNTRHGNLFTMIPVVGWSGRGPDLSIALYHNSANVDSTLNLTRGMGFNLGPGWTTTFSDQIIFDPPGSPTTARVIPEDGTQDVFTLSGGQWVAPAGVFDVLTQVGGPGGNWKLLHKDQTYHLFDPSGLLIEVVDASAGALNKVVIARSSGRISLITDAAGRGVQFNYQGSQLTSVTDLPDAGDPEELGARSWTLQYSAGRLLSVTDPLQFMVAFVYDSLGRITMLEDKDGHAYTYVYWGKQLERVVDPPRTNCCASHPGMGCNNSQCEAIVCGIDPICCATQWDSDCALIAAQSCSVCQSPPPYTPLAQEFDFVCTIGGGVTTTYHDRRDSQWRYTYNLAENLTRFRDPLNHGPTLAYDTAHNVTGYRDALNNEWVSTYDTRGNRLTLQDPLMQVREWTYDALNNLCFVKDAANHEVEIRYEDPDHPTLPTSVIEPPDGQGSGAATTTMTYYNATFDPPQPEQATCNPPAGAWHGLLRDVVDPNGVRTRFQYDCWGQINWTHEGDLTPATDIEPGVFAQQSLFGSAGLGRLHTSWIRGLPTAGSVTHDALGRRATGSTCIPAAEPFSGEAAMPPPGFPELPCNAVVMPANYADANIGYNRMDQVIDLQLDVWQDMPLGQPDLLLDRNRVMVYDELGRLRSDTLMTNEPGSTINRVFAYNYDWANGTYTRTGPDGVETFVQYDTANRVQFVRRGPAGNPLMRADYTYVNDNRVASVSYLGGASTHYTYDNARRLTVIDHRDSSGTSFLKLTYAYTVDDLPDTLTEHTGAVQTASVDFTYDNRHRLIGEVRTGSNSPYTRTYQYDQGGNRTKKIDVTAQIEVTYHYDLEDPPGYDSKNNRLMSYDTVSTAGGQSTPVSTTWYWYNVAGNPTRIVTKPVASPTYTATRLEYAKNAQAVSYVLGETWLWDGQAGHCPTNCTVTYAREFRYDSGRGRYLNRPMDVTVATGLMHNPPIYASAGDVWTDYDEDETYGDYTVSGGTASNARSFELGIATVDPWASSGSTNTKFFHTDLIGTTRSMSAAGLPVLPAVYTAFGERISGTNHRYGYAGEWGYQAQSEFAFLHVGARYYDPSSGRFLQRDPIGIQGGLNVYAYVHSQPTLSVDPDGLTSAAACQDECDKWAKGKGKKSKEDCYMSCLGKYWPPPPARQPPPPGFQRWPGPNPPVSPPRPPGPQAPGQPAPRRGKQYWFSLCSSCSRSLRLCIRRRQSAVGEHHDDIHQALS